MRHFSPVLRDWSAYNTPINVAIARKNTPSSTLLGTTFFLLQSRSVCVLNPKYVSTNATTTGTMNMALYSSRYDQAVATDLPDLMTTINVGTYT